MLDFSNLPDYGQTIFRFDKPCSATEWITWQKPRGCKFIFMEVFGGGGGGGGCQNPAGSPLGTARGGGGGGSAGGRCILFIPAFFVPDTLYIQVGQGGAGAASVTFPANKSGDPGTATRILIAPNNIASNTVLIGNPGTGGGGATSSGSGSGGNNAAATTLASCMMGYMGMFDGPQGAAGGAGAAPPFTSPASVNNIGNASNSGGGGGAGVPTTDASVAGIGVKTLNSLIMVLGTPATQDGNPGYVNRSPWFLFGGGGAASNGAGAGPNGGNGEITCGGGGAGAGITGGTGGNGGSGLVLIMTF